MGIFGFPKKAAIIFYFIGTLKKIDHKNLSLGPDQDSFSDSILILKSPFKYDSFPFCVHFSAISVIDGKNSADLAFS